MNTLLWLLVSGFAVFVGAQQHDGSGGEKGMSMSGNGGEGSSSDSSVDPITMSGGQSEQSEQSGQEGGGRGSHDGGIYSIDEESSEESSFGEYIEENPWLIYLLLGFSILLFCFFCNLACCMCKEAFCRGKCKHCSCRGKRRAARNNNMEQRRQAEYTELQQV